MPALHYKMPVNAWGEYVGPGILDPVQIKTGTSDTLMYLLASFLSYPQSNPAYFVDSIFVFVAPSYSQAEITSLTEGSFPLLLFTPTAPPTTPSPLPLPRLRPSPPSPSLLLLLLRASGL